jgi:hypothetical protein
MIRPRSHKAGKAESLFGDILKPFFDSIDPERSFRQTSSIRSIIPGAL